MGRPRAYRVAASAFFEAFSPATFAAKGGSLPYRIAEDQLVRVEISVAQLVRRYGITGKSILSLGGGYAREEHFLCKHDNRLTIIDIDEYQDIEPVLRAAPPGELYYIIGDANDVTISEQFDVLFLSGFAPDEIRRSDIVRQRDTDTYRRMLKENDGIWEWPPGEEPFHPLVMRFAERLRPGGLMIVQSYYGGFDVLDHRYYMWACDRQLTARGMTLIEAYRFAASTGVMLYVVAMGDHGGLPLFPPITLFHGRAAPERIQTLRAKCRFGRARA